jgi:hypothetical protein
MRCFGKAARMENEVHARFLVGQAKESVTLGKRSCRWDDSTKMDLHERG